MTIVEPTTTVHTDGWEMFGTSDSHNPTLRPTAHPVDWPEQEVCEGVFRIDVLAHGDDPKNAYVKVLATSARAAYDTWQRVTQVVSRDARYWFEGAPF